MKTLQNTTVKEVIQNLSDGAVLVEGALQSAVFESPAPNTYTVYFLPFSNSTKEIDLDEMEIIINDLTKRK